VVHAVGHWRVLHRPNTRDWTEILNTQVDIKPIAHWRVLWGASGLLAVAIVFSFLVALFSLTLPFFMLLTYDRVLNSRSLETLTGLLILACVLIVSMGIFDYTRRRLLARFAARIQEGLEGQLLTLPPHSASLGTTSHLGTKHLDQIRGFTHSASLRHVIDALWLPIFVGAVFLLSPMIGWLAVTALLTLTLVFALGEVLSSQSKRESNRASATSRRLRMTFEHAVQFLGGQSFGREAKRHILDAREGARSTAIEAADVSNAIDTTVNTLRWIFSLLVLSIGATLVLKDVLTVGGMVASVVLLNRVLFPFVAFLRSLSAFRSARDNWRNIGAQIADARALVSPETAKPDHPTLLQWHEVMVRSDADGATLLQDCALVIRPGELLEVNGPAGSGKTLFCETLTWARRPARGYALGLGKRMSRFSPDELAGLIGYVPEVALFFTGSIAANISRFESETHSEAVEAVCESVGLHERIMRLKNGYETKLNEAGAPLSRQDRDLLALARALYSQPRLIVVDQPSETLLARFQGEGGAMLAGFLASGGSVLLTSRRPLPIELPHRALEIAGKTLQQRRQQVHLQPVKTVGQ